MSTTGSMRAVIFNGPQNVSVEQRPIPTLCSNPTNSHGPRELHVFRGHQPSETGFIMGHEFTGTVVEKGAAVTTLNIGDRVVSPFTSSW
ncbi:S-(hydroxymethyl)glutathione dehydrogenase [Colletotrichum spaethianum]|uniref:S-(Hydroxymethyl)glutathione dehydrogenase n=1 Tax=Colletotrichum spaethianum TaxID=700344 RepID=A0AA37LAK1_9PEZI|nr:S-(hydroxymethyl)glutathione dehydrogenase [Colletotrichum spaethianum]GKT43764.1 S-(hydroxymethyl)glutathione dehydrogenase [Colletotrichum spaethianum]